jgi:peptidoglycan/LPS O-acetylase OafA/YrhL
MRASAIALVVMSHYASTRYFSLPTGNLGVEMFFVLSGFLITTLLLRERAGTGIVSLTGFYKRRARRIFPAFYVFWVISIGIELLRGGSLSKGQLAATFFYYTNYYQVLIHPKHSFLKHCWSLAVEEQFYLLWPTFFLVFSKNLRRLAWMTFGVALACAVWRTIAWSIWSSEADWYTYNVFECRADQLLVGCLLAISLDQRWFPKFFSALCASPWWIVATILALLSSARLLQGMARGVFGFVIESLLSGVLLVQAMGIPEWCRLWRWLNGRASAYGARISYALYLYHLTPILSSRIRGLGRLRATILGILLGLAMAHLSYVLVERRFVRSRPQT